MKKVVIFVLLLLISIGSAIAQFDAQLSQYMFHINAFNPAAVGESDLIQLTAQLKFETDSTKKGYHTFAGSVNMPLKINNTLHGIGISFLDDQAGLFTNQAVHVQYAYKKRIGKGVLSVGTEIGFVSIGFDGTKVTTIPIGDYHNITADTEIPKTSVSGMSFDMGLGALYSTPQYYGGISVLHLNNPTVHWGDLNEFREYSTLYLTGGYNWALTDTKYVIKPSTLIKTDYSSLQIDLSARLEYDAKYWGGLTYRMDDSVVLFAGINIASGLTIGYSYDLPTKQLTPFYSGSNEILIKYSFAYVFDKINSKYKSIRIL